MCLLHNILLHEWEGSKGKYLAVLVLLKGGPMQKPRTKYSPKLPNPKSAIIGLLFDFQKLKQIVMAKHLVW